METLDTEKHIKKITTKLTGLHLSNKEKNDLAKEINQLAITLISMYKAKKEVK